MTYPKPIKIIYAGRDDAGAYLFAKYDAKWSGDWSGDSLRFKKNMGAKHIGAIYTITQTDENTFMQDAKFSHQLENNDEDWGKEIKDWRVSDAIAGVRLQERRVQNKIAKEIDLDFWENMSIGELANMARTWNRTQRRLLIARIAQEIENRGD